MCLRNLARMYTVTADTQPKVLRARWCVFQTDPDTIDEFGGVASPIRPRDIKSLRPDGIAKPDQCVLDRMLYKHRSKHRRTVLDPGPLLGPFSPQQRHSPLARRERGNILDLKPG